MFLRSCIVTRIIIVYPTLLTKWSPRKSQEVRWHVWRHHGMSHGRILDPTYNLKCWGARGAGGLVGWGTWSPGKLGSN